jgi:gas vesicle protein
MRNIESMTSFLAGLGIGVAASVLLAPKSGSETQTKLKEIANRAGDALNLKAKDIGAAASGAFKGAKQKVDEASDAARSAAGHAADKSRDVVHEVGKRMENGGKMLQDV